jgi:hypothetical protein
MVGPKLIDRVRESTTSTGSGTLTLGGAAVGYQAFSAVMSDADICLYCVTDGTNWEVGLGTLGGSGTTLARTTVLASSNGGSAVNFPVGTKDVFLTHAADEIRYLVATGAYSTLASVQQGRLNFPTDGYSVLLDDGEALQPWGPLYAFTPPVNGDFAWVNQGSATVTATKGGILLQDVTGASLNVRIRKKAAPAPPYTITVAILPGILVDINGIALLFRESSSGKFHALFMQIQTGALNLFSAKFDSATSFNASYAGPQPVLAGFPLFLRIADDNSNRIVSLSWDGQNFQDYHSVGRTDFITADEVGFGVFSQNASIPAHLTLLSWKQA